MAAALSTILLTSYRLYRGSMHEHIALASTQIYAMVMGGTLGRDGFRISDFGICSVHS